MVSSMYLMYIDESGDTVPLSSNGKKFLVLTGCVIHEAEIQEIEKKLRAIKQKYYQDPNIEIKSNFLRYANPDLSESSPLKLNAKDKYDELEAEVNKFLIEIPVLLFSVVIDKEKYWEQYPSQNPYDIAYIFLLERFQMFLDDKDALGISIIDPREGQVEKHFMGEELDRIHNRMRWEESKFWTKCPRIIEKLLFSQSDKTIGIQIADLYCYPIFNIFEYGNKNYWRYKEQTLPKLQRSPKGTIEGWGLKIFPNNEKRPS